METQTLKHIHTHGGRERERGEERRGEKRRGEERRGEERRGEENLLSQSVCSKDIDSIGKLKQRIFLLLCKPPQRTVENKEKHDVLDVFKSMTELSYYLARECHLIIPPD
jgi:hypothetical protein